MVMVVLQEILIDPVVQVEVLKLMVLNHLHT